MCGIFASYGKDLKTPEKVIEGLKKLEYRGYDSYGIAYMENGNMVNKKSVGKISEFDIKKENLGKSHIAISHTRWATHGGVKKCNAHPHFDEKEEIAVVHNGIIENYEDLKKELIGRGHKFLSETDTEVIPHLIEEHIDLGLKKAVEKTVARLEGRFALVAMNKDDDFLVSARRGSPLIIGRGENETFIASDIPAFLEHTRTVNYLDDDELVIVDKNGAKFYSLKDGSEIEKRNIIIEWKREEAEKGDFTHFMMKEIFDQKESLYRAIEQDDEEIMQVAKKIKKARGVFWVGCGTAGKVAQAGEYFFANVAKRHTNFAPASEFPLFHNFLRPETLIFAISQSGETADVLEAMEVAEKAGSSIFSLVNVVGSSISRKSDMSLFIKAGLEKAVASTKAATSQMAVLLLLAYAVAEKLEEGKKLLADTASNVNELLNPRFVEHVKKISKDIADQNNMFIIGKGANFPLAMEAAIKIQEVSQIHAEGFAGGELKHGPIAMIDEGVPCIVLVGDDESRKEIVSNAIELKARGARIIGVSYENEEVFDDFIKVPKAGPASPIVNLIPIQLMAFFLGLERGCNPDMPKNLAKSVTVK